MITTLPKIFISNNYLNRPLNYKWNDRIEEKIEQGEHTKLNKMLEQLNFKATFGLGIAASEWIFWRIFDWQSGYENGARKYTEAHWLGLISHFYMTDWDYGVKYPSNDKIKSLAWDITKIFEWIRLFYKENRGGLYYKTSQVIMFARHISEYEEFFDTWFEDCLKRSIALFPDKRMDKKGKQIESYLPEQDPFIPRDFYFDPEFDYQSADLKALQLAMLNEADYKKNQFIRTPENMLEKGFKGTPYQLD